MLLLRAMLSLRQEIKSEQKVMMTLIFYQNPNQRQMEMINLKKIKRRAKRVKRVKIVIEIENIAAILNRNVRNRVEMNPTVNELKGILRDLVIEMSVGVQVEDVGERTILKKTLNEAMQIALTDWAGNLKLKYYWR